MENQIGRPWLREKKELMAVSSRLILRPSRKQMANGLDWHLHTDDHRQHQQSMRASTSLRCFPNGGGSTKLSAETKSMFRLLLRWSLIRLVLLLLRLVPHVTVALCPERESHCAADARLTTQL
jgi:hypothetical protein